MVHNGEMQYCTAIYKDLRKGLNTKNKCLCYDVK